MKKLNLLVSLLTLSLLAACSKSELQKEDPPSRDNTEIANFHFSGVKTVDTPESKGVALYSKLWHNQTVINIKLMNGDAAQMAEVISVASEWEQYIPMRFNWVTSGNADVRVAIDATRRISWSAVGTDCKAITNQNEPTMNIAFSSLLEADARRGAILRAFGQMLGLELEHRHINLVNSWNYVDIFYPALWSEIPRAEFQKYVIDPITDAANVVETQYDPASIMVMGFPVGVLVLNNGYAAPTADGKTLSATDKQFIAQLYATTPNNYVTLSHTSFETDHNATSFDIAVTSNTSWTLTAPNWCTLNTVSGSGNATVTVTVSANTTGNERTGYIRATANGTNDCVVKQRGLTTFSFSPTSLEFPQAGSTVNLTINSNTSWTLTAPSWVSLGATSGSGNSTITVRTSPNNTINRLTGNITATYRDSDGNTKTVNCPVSQLPQPAYGGTLNVRVYFKNQYNQPVSVSGNYQVQLAGTTIATIYCSGSLAANSSSSVQVGSGSGTYRSGNTTLALNVGFSSWGAASVPLAVAVSGNVTGNARGSISGTLSSGSLAGKYTSSNIVWDRDNGTATLEITYTVGGPGGDV